MYHMKGNDIDIVTDGHKTFQSHTYTHTIYIYKTLITLNPIITLTTNTCSNTQWGVFIKFYLLTFHSMCPY